MEKLLEKYAAIVKKYGFSRESRNRKAKEASLRCPYYKALYCIGFSLRPRKSPEKLDMNGLHGFFKLIKQQV
jgi:hypothetical protein